MPKKAKTKTKEHIHVGLPNGAIVKVSPDCPKKTMDALYEMTEAVKRLPKNWGKVNGKVFRNEALDAAIERGERLEKIAEICAPDIIGGLFNLPSPMQVQQIYRLAKGLK